MTRFRVILALSLFAAVGTASYFVGQARAAGVPAESALTYSGTLTDGDGKPLSGERNVQFILWGDATSEADEAQRCATRSTPHTLVGGRFQVPLPEECAAAVHDTPDLWIELLIDGTSLGRAKVAAVPYALEAAVATDATGALHPTSVAVRGAITATGNVNADGDVAAPANKHGKCAWQEFVDSATAGGDSPQFVCPAGTFVAGIQLRNTPETNASVDKVSVYCCGL